MNEQLYYDSESLAWIFAKSGLSMKEQSLIVNGIYQTDLRRLHPRYRRSKLKLVREVSARQEWILHHRELEDEVSAAMQDISDLHPGEDAVLHFLDENQHVERFFKSVRLQLLFLPDKAYVRAKLRTIMKEYGYKRRSEKFQQYLEECLRYYQIKVFLKGGSEIRIRDARVDDMLTLRIIERK